jgi:hypothetical protein
MRMVEGAGGAWRRKSASGAGRTRAGWWREPDRALVLVEGAEPGGGVGGGSRTKRRPTVLGPVGLRRLCEAARERGDGVWGLNGRHAGRSTRGGR